jgi:competence protein ComEC
MPLGISDLVAVICVGTDNPFGHPSPEVLERLTDRLGEDNVYRTDQDGTIEFITDGETLWVKADSWEIYSLAMCVQ